MAEFHSDEKLAILPNEAFRVREEEVQGQQMAADTEMDGQGGAAAAELGGSDNMMMSTDVMSPMEEHQPGQGSAAQ